MEFKKKLYNPRNKRTSRQESLTDISNNFVQNKNEKNINNIQSYLSEPNSNNKNNLKNILLPQDINFYFSNSEEIKKKIETKFINEQKEVESFLDEFLKKLILISEETKNILFKKIIFKKNNMLDFYDNFYNSINEFLEISKYQMDEVNHIYDKEYNKIFNNKMDPLENQLMKFKLEKNRCADIEETFFKIKKTYNASIIPENKIILDEILNNPNSTKKSIDKELILTNLKNLSDYIDIEMKNLTQKKKTNEQKFEENRLKSSKFFGLPLKNNFKRPLSSNKVDILQKIRSNIQNLDFRPNSKTEKIKIKPKSSQNRDILNFNLKKNRVNRNSNQSTHLSDSSKPSKNNLINININNNPQNSNHFINIYNQQNDKNFNPNNKNFLNTTKNYTKQTKNFSNPLNPNPKNFSTMSKKLYNKSRNLEIMNKYKNKSNLKKINYKRPSSAMNYTRKNLNSSNLNTSFTRDIFKPFSPIISSYKTNMLSKQSLKFDYYSTFEIFKNNDDINCFEIDNNSNFLFYGQKNGLLNRVELDNIVIKNKLTLQFDSEIINICQFSSSQLLITLKKNSNNLLLVNITKFQVEIPYKTFDAKIKHICSFGNSKFLAITDNDKSFLYSNNSPIPLKSFKFKTSKIIDAVMPSSKMIFTGSSDNEIRIFDINFENSTLKGSGFLKLESEIKNLEIFHNNERLLIVNSMKKKENLIYIINIRTKKVMNIIKQNFSDLNHNNFSQNSPNFEIRGILTFTVIKKPPEIFLVSFSDGKISFCDIDKRELKNKMVLKKGKELFFKGREFFSRVVKILSHNSESLNLIALCDGGIYYVKFEGK